MSDHAVGRRVLIGAIGMGALALYVDARHPLIVSRALPITLRTVTSPSSSTPVPSMSRSQSARVAASARTQRPPPRFTGVTTYVDPSGRFSFRYPTDWHRLDAADRSGVVIVPDTTDPDTALSARTNSLGQSVHREDLNALIREVDGYLGTLPDARVELRREVAYGNVLKLEREVAFRDELAVRKRKVWIVYAGECRIELGWQGSTEDEFDFWLAMANYSFATFLLGPELWSAFDDGSE